jgi:MFS family permease
MGVFSLGLLAYVGFGEASNNYPRYEVEKVTAQARAVQSTLEKYLNAGLPLRQFAGFETLVSPIIRIDDAIDGMVVADRLGRVVFETAQSGVSLTPVAEVVDPDALDVKVVVGEVYTQVILPLRSRFGFGGQLVSYVPNKYVENQINSATAILPWAAAIGSLVLGVFGAAVAGMAGDRRSRWDKIVFVTAFLAVAGTVVVGLANLYSTGARTKAIGLSGALTERLSVVYDLGLSLDDVEGFERTFSDYRRLNPDLRTMALIVDGKVVIHTDPAAIGKPFVPDRNAFEEIQTVDNVPGLDVKVSVSIPYDVVYLAVGRSAKTFIVLLVASGFMAGLFFQLGGALRRMRQANDMRSTDGQSAVEAIKPALFMGFFVENLSVSFLPQLMQKSAIAGGLPPSIAAAMFMAYFITFAGALVPAGIYAARHGPKRLIFAGALIVVAASSLIALSDHYAVIVLSRLMSGLGQGLLFIGSQSYILAYAAADKRTQSAGIIVYTFNGGMLSGMVIGGLLVGYVGSTGVFWIGAATALVIALYTWLLIAPPRMAQIEDTSIMRSPKAILGVFKSGGFLWTTLLVGMPAKAVLTGVIIFAMPLILSGLNLEQEDIGQVIMFYALGVLLASHYVSRYADRFGRLRDILFIGLTLSGVGLGVIGSVGWTNFGTQAIGPIAVTLVLLSGTFIVGLGHGFINAPVISFIASTEAARKLGEAPVTAFYRFIERVGHIAGPLVVGQLFFLSDRSPAILIWLGLAMVIFAVLFLMRQERKEA